MAGTASSDIRSVGSTITSAHSASREHSITTMTQRGLDPDGFVANEENAAVSLSLSEAESSLTYGDSLVGDQQQPPPTSMVEVVPPPATTSEQQREVSTTLTSSSPAAAATTTAQKQTMNRVMARNIKNFVQRNARKHDCKVSPVVATSARQVSVGRAEDSNPNTSSEQQSRESLKTQAVIRGASLSNLTVQPQPQTQTNNTGDSSSVTMPIPSSLRLQDSCQESLPSEVTNPTEQQEEEQTGQDQNENPPTPSHLFATFPPNASATGKALEFTQKIVQIHQRWAQSTTQGIASADLLSLCHADDIVFFTEQLLLHQEKSEEVAVDLAYCLAPWPPPAAARRQQQRQGERVRAESLFTTSSRDAVFGVGIYTCNSLFTGEKLNWKGKTRLFLVARRLGKGVRVGATQVSSSVLRSKDVETVMGQVGTEEVAVLRRSSQCLPLLQIDPQFLFQLSHAQGNIILSNYQKKLKGTIDEYLNVGISVVSPVPPASPARTAHVPPDVPPALSPAPPAGVPTNASSGENDPRMRTILYYRAPTSQRRRESLDPPSVLMIDANVNLKTQKPLHPRHTTAEVHRNPCRTSSSSGVVRIIPPKPPLPDTSTSRQAPQFSMAYQCGSTFNMAIDPNRHSDNMNWQSLLDDHALLERIQTRVHEHARRCTFGCRRHSRPQCDFTTPIGAMPSGSMRVDELPDLTCPGYSTAGGSFLIAYRISGGLQCDYHANPGVGYQSIYREAFLPVNSEGRALLKRFQFAFSRGLTFQVGTSLTTGASDSVTWAIPHKSTLAHHLFGYPDPDYFTTANSVLDDMGVPIASDLS